MPGIGTIRSLAADDATIDMKTSDEEQSVDQSVEETHSDTI
jgi:hypothetical protein